MISLAVAERIAAAAYPDHHHAVVALPDARRGERLVLVTDTPHVLRDALVSAAQREGLPEIAVPRDVLTVPALPLLGSGKTDYPSVSRLVVQSPAAVPSNAPAIEVPTLAAG